MQLVLLADIQKRNDQMAYKTQKIDYVFLTIMGMVGVILFILF